MKSRLHDIEGARLVLEQTTRSVIFLVRRNEFIGKPVTRLEERFRRQRNLAIKRELARAQLALNRLTRAAQAKP